ncbi:MAG: hypothetical protein KGM96_03295 [Acidobacteriota bacterium]|nr:hypothetical protein [Acidobacteriota bacterium]
MPYALAETPTAEVRSPSVLGRYQSADVRDAGMQWVRARDTNAEYFLEFARGSSGEAAEVASMKSYRLAKAIKKWQKYVMNPDAATDVDALTETVEAVLDFISEFGPSALSLHSVQAEAVQCEHLAAALRASSSWRGQIPGWDLAIKATADAARSAHLDPEDVLYGMI